MRILGVIAILAVSACSDPKSPQAQAPHAVVMPQAPVAPVAAMPAPSSAADAGNDRSDERYLDDRSNTQALIRSYFNAINRKEYARAWSYWSQGSSVQPYGTFKQGFAKTKRTEVTFGNESSEGAAGSVYTTQRIALEVTNEDGRQEFFAGCYATHLSQPAIQDQVPFKPLGIRQAKVTKVDTGTAAKALLSQPCEMD